MRVLYTQFSGLAGILAFLNQVWSMAPIERTLIIAFGTGLGVYLLLMLGDIAINRILAYTPSTLAKETRGSGDSNAEAGEKPAAKAA